MKKPYQIGAGRAVQRVRQWAEEKNPAVQLMLPMIEILALAKQGAGELFQGGSWEYADVRPDHRAHR